MRTELKCIARKSAAISTNSCNHECNQRAISGAFL